MTARLPTCRLAFRPICVSRSLVLSLRLTLEGWHLASPFATPGASTSHLAMLAFACLVALAAQASAHGFVSNIKGSNGKTTQGVRSGRSPAALTPPFAVTPGKPVFQQSQVAVFGNGGAPCGTTNGKAVDIAAGMAAAVSAGLATVAPGATVTADWEQINAGSDGAGPGSIFVDTARRSAVIPTDFCRPVPATTSSRSR